MDGRLQHTVIDDQNTPATGPRSYSTIKLKKGEFFLAEDLTSFKVGDGTKTYESITEDNTYYAGKGAGSAYKFKLNGTTYPSGTLPEYTKDLSNNGIYAPLSGGSGNQVLISLGNNTAPTWANVNISDGLGIINPVGDTYNLILRASSSGHLGGVYSNYSDLFLNNYRVLSSGQSNTDPNYPEVTIFAPTTSTTSASGASISNQLLISQADNQAPIWTGLTLNGSTNGKYLKWDNGWTLDNAGGGTNAYVHIKYANSSNPQDSDMHNIPAVGDKYIGVYSGSASVAPTDHASYVWSKYVGEDGTSVDIKPDAASCEEEGDGYISDGTGDYAEGHLIILTDTTTIPWTWVDAGLIKGPAGEDGATWNNGTDVGDSSHTTPFTSTTLTESDVKSGDYYLNSTTYDVYKCTAATNSNSSWLLVCNIKGATGNTGSTGATGNGISSIEGPVTSGLYDTYTINFTNGNSTTFTVTNGADGTDGVSIGSILRTSGTGAAGTADTYTVYDTDGNSIGTFNVYNGADGTAVGDSWRAIQVEGTQILGTGTNTSPLNLSAGPHTIVSRDANNVGKVVIQANYITTLNGTGYPTADNNNSLGSWYAPTTVGTNGQLLKSSGNGAPTWDSAFNILGATGHNGKYLKATSTGLEWGTPSGGTTYYAGTAIEIDASNHINVTAPYLDSGEIVPGYFAPYAIASTESGGITDLGSNYVCYGVRSLEGGIAYVRIPNGIQTYTIASTDSGYTNPGLLKVAANANCAIGYQNIDEVTAIPIFYGTIGDLKICKDKKYVEGGEFTGHYVNLYDVVNGIIKNNTLLRNLKEALDNYTPKP